MDLILQDITLNVAFVEHRRIQHDISISDVSKLLGITRGSYYNKISRKSEFKISELVKLGELYGDDFKNYLDESGRLIMGTVLVN